jgi:HEAT repeat protein
VEAASALGRIHSIPNEVVPVLISCLSSEDPNLRVAAADSLSAFGREAVEAMPPIKNLLHDSNGVVRAAATNALERILKSVNQ